MRISPNELEIQLFSDGPCKLSLLGGQKTYSPPYWNKWGAMPPLAPPTYSATYALCIYIHTDLVPMHMHTHVYIHKHMHTQAYTHTHTHTHMHANMYTHTHTCVRAHTHTHAHTHTYTHRNTCMNTHTHKFSYLYALYNSVVIFVINPFIYYL